MDKHWLKMSKKLETKVPSFSIHKYAEKGEKNQQPRSQGPFLLVPLRDTEQRGWSNSGIYAYKN